MIVHEIDDNFLLQLKEYQMRIYIVRFSQTLYNLLSFSFSVIALIFVSLLLHQPNCLSTVLLQNNMLHEKIYYLLIWYFSKSIHHYPNQKHWKRSLYKLDIESSCHPMTLEQQHIFSLGRSHQ